MCNCTEFVLTPFTTEERCVLARDQLLQLQNEHGQLQSLLGQKIECKKESPVEKESLCTRHPSNSIHCCRLPLAEQEEKRETGNEYRNNASSNDSEYEAEKRRLEQSEVLLSNLLEEKRRLEKQVSKINFKLEVENLQLKAERHIHNRIIFQIQSRRELETTSLQERTELRKKLAQTKEFVKRVQNQNAVLAGYVLRKSAKLVSGNSRVGSLTSFAIYPRPNSYPLLDKRLIKPLLVVRVRLGTNPKYGSHWTESLIAT